MRTTESIAEQFHFDLEDFTTLDAGRAKLVLERDFGGADVAADITAPEPVKVFRGDLESYKLTLFGDGSLIVDTNADTEIWREATDWIDHVFEPRGPRGGMAYENMDRVDFEFLGHFDRLDEDDLAFLAK